MKYSETPEEIRARRLDYTQARWNQLSDLATSWGEEAIKYLLIINTGAMAGALSFIGAMPHLRGRSWPTNALSFFVLGVVLIGAYHALRVLRIDWLFKHWRNDVDAYRADKFEWNELLDRDAARWPRGGRALIVIASLSFMAFLFGLGIAAFHFSEITPP